MEKRQLTQLIKNRAGALGFEKVGIAPAGKPAHSDYLSQWLKAGYHGAMQWMENNAEKRQDVFKLYPQAKSVIAVGLNYFTGPKHSSKKEHGKISRYAWGKDYHKIMKKNLKQILIEIKQKDASIDGRLCVDTAPAQDKLWAAEAGIGWQGKNTNILSRDYGSWLFLGEIILNKELEYDTPVSDYCGTCTACIDACPTEALTPYKLDATKCISYLTIEMWDKPIPPDYRDKMHNWVFGCDICQDVCPWNRFEKETTIGDFQPHEGNICPDLSTMGKMTVEEFKKRFKNSPVYRAKWHNFIRNVKTVLQSGRS
jgi:epoxyqueuosine reductase